MKYILITLIMAGTVVFVPSLQAQTVSPTKTSTPSATIKPTTQEEKQIENLKENIATKVSELRKKGNKALAGTLTATSSAQITLKDSSGAQQKIKLDETLTKVYQINGSQKKELKISDLKKDMYAIVSGPLLDNMINASVIYIDEQFIVRSGKVTEVDTTQGMLKVITQERDNLTLDVPTTLRMQMIDIKTLAEANTTFSKIKEGDSIHFTYNKAGNEKQVNTYQAVKVLIIPQEYFQQEDTAKKGN